MTIKITKMQGCGNDFVVLEYNEFQKFNSDMSEVAKKLCDRNFGIGADGLIIPNLSAEGADIGWFFYNSDGTPAQMCGNGMRCFARYVYEKGGVKFEIDDYIRPQMKVVAIEGNKDEVDKVYNELLNVISKENE